MSSEYIQTLKINLEVGKRSQGTATTCLANLPGLVVIQSFEKIIDISDEGYIELCSLFLM